MVHITDEDPQTPSLIVVLVIVLSAIFYVKFKGHDFMYELWVLWIVFVITVVISWLVFRKMYTRLSFLKEKLKGSAAKLEDVIQVIKTSERGVYKRIDENRELFELLQEECPDFIERHFWIKGWLAAQDRFLSELADVSCVDNPLANESQGRIYPRPFPKKDASRNVINNGE